MLKQTWIESAEDAQPILAEYPTLLWSKTSFPGIKAELRTSLDKLSVVLVDWYSFGVPCDAPKGALGSVTLLA
jgi:hypothetical protein